MYTNDKTRKVKAGNIYIGGGAPISVQSMLCVPVHDIEGNVAQAKALQAAGCDIVRVTVPDKEALKTVASLTVGFIQLCPKRSAPDLISATLFS